MKNAASLLALCLCLLSQAVRADVLDTYQFTGTLAGKPINVTFVVDESGLVVGETCYPESNKPVPMLIVGSILVVKQDGRTIYIMDEYRDDGTITGELFFETNIIDGVPIVLDGGWSDPWTGKSEDITVITDISQFADSPPIDIEKYLAHEDPDSIGSYYSYEKWDSRRRCMRGGHISFSPAGDRKLHFECSNLQHDIYTYSSPEDRPAQLGDYTYNYFVYEDMNEYGYGFRADFFKRFVVLRSITYHNTRKGGSLDGVYIKIK